MRKLERTVARNKKLRKLRYTGVACVTALATTFGSVDLPFITMVKPVSVMADTITIPGAPADAEVIDISKVTLNEKGIIDITISESGSYVLTGSNYVASGDCFADFSLTVLPGVEADIYLYDFSVKNNTFEESCYDLTTNIMNFRNPICFIIKLREPQTCIF